MATRWYRAPEIMLNSKVSTTAQAGAFGAGHSPASTGFAFPPAVFLGSEHMRSLEEVW